MMGDVQHFIYPLSETSGHKFLPSGDITPENFWRDVEKFDWSEWGLSTGFKLIEPGDWVWAYFGRSVKRIYGVGRVEGPVRWRAPNSQYAIVIRWDRKLTNRLKNQPINYEDYQQHVQSAAPRANLTTVEVLEAWLGDEAPSALDDARKVQFSERSVMQRLGQADFRTKLLRAYGQKCVISGCAEVGVLQAAHIRAVGQGGDHSIHNGLILRADLHNLFDLGLVTVGNGLKIEVAASVKDRSYRKFEGKRLTPGDGVIRSKLSKALAEHRTLHSQSS